MSTDTQNSTPVSAELVALPQCPFPCGWSGLHKIAVQDAAYLAKVQWPEDEEGVSVQRATAMRSMDSLIQVCRTMLNAAPVAAQAQQPNENAEWEAAAKKHGQDAISGRVRWNPLPGGGMYPHPNGIYVRFDDLAQKPVSGASQGTEANNRRKALLENQGKGEVPSWTGHGDADAALIMLDRLDVSGGDNDRVDEISAIIRNLAAKQDQLRDAAQMIESSGNSGELPRLPLNDPAAAYRVLHDYGQSCAHAALALSHPDTATYQQAKAWKAVCAALDFVNPRWTEEDGKGEECAVKAIVNLAQQDADPLQDAADWLVKDCGVSDVVELAGRLSIGYNRANRLIDAARKEPGQ